MYLIAINCALTSLVFIREIIKYPHGVIVYVLLGLVFSLGLFIGILSLLAAIGHSE